MAHGGGGFGMEGVDDFGELAENFGEAFADIVGISLVYSAVEGRGVALVRKVDGVGVGCAVFADVASRVDLFARSRDCSVLWLGTLDSGRPRGGSSSGSCQFSLLAAESLSSSVSE